VADADHVDPGLPEPHEYRRLDLVEVLVSMVLIFVLDVVAGFDVQLGEVFTKFESNALIVTQVGAALTFVVLAGIALYFGLHHNLHSLLRTFAVYLTVATVQVLVTIAFMLTSNHVRGHDYLWGLSDAVGVYLLTMSVFAGWYLVADHLTQGGAFAFPSRSGRRVVRRGRLVDYLFISFNTNSTFGPTTELILSRKVKLLMMLQTVCSLVILLVLTARLLGRT